MKTTLLVIVSICVAVSVTWVVIKTSTKDTPVESSNVTSQLEKLETNTMDLISVELVVDDYEQAKFIYRDSTTEDREAIRRAKARAHIAKIQYSVLAKKNRDMLNSIPDSVILKLDDYQLAVINLARSVTP